MIVAGPAHAAACAAIHASAFPPKEAWREDAFATLLNSPGVHGLIAPAPAGLAGGAGVLLIRLAADEGEIQTLATSPPTRRQGVARGLLAAGLALAASGGARLVFLEVGASNAAALALYTAAGFRVCGRRPGYYPGGGEALVMQVNPGG